VGEKQFLFTLTSQLKEVANDLENPDPYGWRGFQSGVSNLGKIPARDFSA